MQFPNEHFIVVIDKVDKLRFELTNAYHLVINLLRNRNSIRHSVATGVVEGRNGSVPFMFKTRVPYSKYLLLQFQLFNIYNVLIGQYTLDTSNFNKEFNTLRAQLRLEKPDRTRNGNLHVYIELRPKYYTTVSNVLCFIKPVVTIPELDLPVKEDKDIEISESSELVHSPIIQEVEPTQVETINLFITTIQSKLDLFTNPYISVSIGEQLYGSPLLSDCESTLLGTHILSLIYSNEPNCSVTLWEFVTQDKNLPCLKIATAVLNLNKLTGSQMPIHFKFHVIKCLNAVNHMDSILLNYTFEAQTEWFDTLMYVAKSSYPSVDPLPSQSPSLSSPEDIKKNPFLNNLSVCRKPVKVIRTSKFNKTNVSNVLFKFDYEKKCKPLLTIDSYFIMRLVCFCLSDAVKNESLSIRVYMGHYMATIPSIRSDQYQNIVYFSFSPIMLISSKDRYMTLELYSEGVKRLKQYKINLSSFFMDNHSIYCESLSPEYSQLLFQLETIQTSLEFAKNHILNKNVEKEMLNLDTFNVDASPCGRTTSTYASSISPAINNYETPKVSAVNTPVAAKFPSKYSRHSITSVPVEFPFLDKNHKKWRHFVQNSV